MEKVILLKMPVTNTRNVFNRSFPGPSAVAVVKVEEREKWSASSDWEPSLYLLISGSCSCSREISLYLLMSRRRCMPRSSDIFLLILDIVFRLKNRFLEDRDLWVTSSGCSTCKRPERLDIGAEEESSGLSPTIYLSK